MTEKNELHTNLNKYRNMTHPDDKKWLNPNENKHDKNDRKMQNTSKYIKILISGFPGSAVPGNS